MSDWPVGWCGIPDLEGQQHLNVQVDRLLSQYQYHPMGGLALEAIAEMPDEDEYLFRMSDGRVAEFHLPLKKPGGITTILYDSVEEWRVRRNDFKR